MSDHYLPTIESLGYKNTKVALMNIFSLNLDDLEIRKGEFENFSFVIEYKKKRINLGISSSGQNIQFEAGEGGLFNIWFYDSDNSKNSLTFLYEVLDNEKKKNDIKKVFGKSQESIEHALIILKEYLDSVNDS